VCCVSCPKCADGTRSIRGAGREHLGLAVGARGAGLRAPRGEVRDAHEDAPQVVPLRAAPEVPPPHLLAPAPRLVRGWGRGRDTELVIHLMESDSRDHRSTPLTFYYAPTLCSFSGRSFGAQGGGCLFGSYQSCLLCNSFQNALIWGGDF